MKSSEQHARCAALAVFPAVLLALASVSCGQTDPDRADGDTGGPVIEYAQQADALVLSLRQTGGMIDPPDTTPLLRIYGDGRALVHFPAGSVRAGEYSLRLTEAELAALLESLSAKGIMTFDGEAVRRMIGDAIRARTEAEGGPVPRAAVADDVTTIIEVRLERYRPADSSRAPLTDLRETVPWYALQAEARQYPEVAPLQMLAAAERELMDLAMRDDLEAVGP